MNRKRLKSSKCEEWMLKRKERSFMNEKKKRRRPLGADGYLKCQYPLNKRVIDRFVTEETQMWAQQ